MRYRLGSRLGALASLASASLLLLASGVLPAAASPAAAAPSAATSTTGSTTSSRGPCPNPPVPTMSPLPHGALAMYCVPAKWNGDLVVWAHGYVDASQPIGFYNLSIPDGQGGTVYLPDLVEGLGFAFATTSYRANGLVILDGVQDMEELVDGFAAATGLTPRRVYQTGASEGGLVTTLLAERSPQRFSGALALCGPIGSFRGEIDYVGDMRAVFDYFYPGVLPGSPISVPSFVMANWASTYLPAVQHAINANPDAASQLYRVVRAPVNPDPAGLATTATDVLWYGVFATDNASQVLHGNPYGNAARQYSGSANDAQLNAGVERVSADPAALLSMLPYETSGRVSIPLVTLHTTGDDVIPFWHEVLYAAKAARAGSRVTPIPVNAYGHCNFTLPDVLGAFAVLVLQVSHQPLATLPT